MIAPEHRERSTAIVFDALMLLLFSLGLLLQLLFEDSQRASSMFLIHFCFNLSFLLIALHLIFSSRLRRKPSPFDLLIAAYFIYGLLNCALALVKFEAVKQAPFLFDGLTAYLLGTTVLWYRFRGFALLAVLLSLVVMAGEALLSPAGLTFRSPAILFLMISIPFTLYLFIAHYPRPSRGVFRLARSAFLAMCAIITIWVASEVWQGRTDVARYEDEKNIHYASQAALHTFLERPIVGVGAGGGWLLAQAKSAVPLSSPIGYYPGYLPFLSEFGVIGALFFVLIVVSFFLLVFRPGRSAVSFESQLRTLAIGASAFGLLIVGFFGIISPTLSFNVLFWVLFGMIAAKSGVTTSQVAAEGSGASEENIQSDVPPGERTLRFRARVPRYVAAIIVAVLIAVITLAEGMPLLIQSLTTRRQGEDLDSNSYAERLLIASRLVPFDPKPHLLLAAHYRAKLDKERDVGKLLPQIVKEYEDAIALNPYGADGYFQLAELYRRDGKLRDSLLVLERGMSYNPNSFELNAALISNYEQHGWLGRAIEHAREVSVRFPGGEGIDIRLFKIYMRSANRADARLGLYHALQIDPLSLAVSSELEKMGSGKISSER
jgi:hypothetical protein